MAAEGSADAPAGSHHMHARAGTPETSAEAEPEPQPRPSSRVAAALIAAEATKSAGRFNALVNALAMGAVALALVFLGGSAERGAERLARSAEHSAKNLDLTLRLGCPKKPKEQGS